MKAKEKELYQNKKNLLLIRNGQANLISIKFK
jgi:hypothetical protein